MKKTVIKEEVEMYGDIPNCGNCASLDKKVNSVIPKSEIPIEYKHYDVNNDKIGIEVAKKEKLDSIPYVKYCKITEDEKKHCDTITGFDEKDWNNLGKKREEDFSE